MRVWLPSCAGHFEPKGGRHAVYSLDFQPDGHRLATAGGDCTVKIWNVDLLLKSAQGSTSSLIATLSSHEKSVNVVRWSKDGALLASGGDDNQIIVHRRVESTDRLERWIRCHMFQGHQMNVLDLCWSGRGLLATASVDNDILIWKCGEGALVQHVPLHRLTAHRSHVKGLSFDPLDKLLVSVGADNSVVIWDCAHGFAILQTLDKSALGGSPDCTLFRRPDWSPDALSVCLPCALKKGKDVGLVLKRSVWTSAADLVGHRSAVSAVRFSQFLRRGSVTSSSSVTDPATLVAVADLSGGLSVWSSASTRPLLVLHEALPQQITDLAWARRRQQSQLLAACSLSGELILVDLGQLGGPLLTSEEESAHVVGMFGAPVQDVVLHNPLALRMQAEAEVMEPVPAAATGTLRPPEAPAAAVTTTITTVEMESELSNTTCSVPLAQAGCSASFMGNSATSEQTLRLQDTGSTHTGKRRITPVCLQSLSTGSDGSSTTAPATAALGEASRGTKAVSDASDLDRDRSAKKRRAADEPRTILNVVLKRDEVTLDFLLPALAAGGGDGVYLRGKALDLGQTVRAPLLIEVERLQPPRSFTALQRSGAQVSVVRCPGDGPGEGPRWTAVLGAEVLCVAAFRAAPASTDEGWVIAGAKNGTIHIVDLRTGLKICAPLILGASVVHTALARQSDRSARALFLCADGTLHAFTFSLDIQEVRRAGDGTGSCDLRPLLLSLLAARANPTADLRVSVARCYLHGRNLAPVVSLFTYIPAANNGISPREYVVHAFHAASGCWQRLVDSGLLMSNLFQVLTTKQVALPEGVQGETAVDGDRRVRAMEVEVSSGLALTSQELLSIARARTSAAADSAGATSAPQWSALVTLAHAEERVVSALETGSDSEALVMLADYVTACCKCEDTRRVELLASLLLRGEEPAVCDGGDVHTTPGEVCGDGNGLRAWCRRLRATGRANDVLREVLVRTVARESNLSAQLLLSSLTAALQVAP